MVPYHSLHFHHPWWSAAMVPYHSLHLTHRDVGNAANRMERLQPHHPWWSAAMIPYHYAALPPSLVVVDKTQQMAGCRVYQPS